MSLDVCVATSASIETNCKPDLISFLVHITLPGGGGGVGGGGEVSYVVKW